MSGDELPEGWGETPLEEIVDHILGGDWGTAVSGQGDGESRVRVIRGTDFKSWTSQRGATAPIRAIKESSLQKRRLKDGDIVLEVSGGGPDQPVGRSLLVDESTLSFSTEPFVCSNFCRRVRLKSGVDSALVNLFLRWQYAQGGLDRFQNQTTNLRNLQVPELLAGLMVPIPPIAEQKRITTKVEELLVIVNAARDRLAHVPIIVRRFRRSVLAAACEGKLTEVWRGAQASSLPVIGKEAESALHVELPESWRWLEAASLCDPARALTYGVIKLGPSVARGIPTLRSSNVRPLFIDTSEVKCISKEIASEYSRTTLRGNEALITVRGTLGGIAVARPEMVGWNVSREVAVLPVLSGRCDPGYLVIAIASRGCQSWLMERAKGVAYTGINIEDLKLLPIPTPTLAEQHEIVRRVEALFRLADAIEKRVATATARAQKLTQAILSRAFGGELVPNEAELARRDGREYEPAAALLDRIQSLNAPGPERPRPFKAGSAALGGSRNT